MPESVRARLSHSGRTNTLLFAAGFHFANYTREMIFAAKDLDAENRCDELLGIVEEVKRFRASWIEGIVHAARENPDLLLVLKKHPIERREDYAALEGLGNVLYVWQDVDIGDLIDRAGVFFHYGSTSLADAYLARIPAVYLHSREKRCHEWFPDLGWPSARAASSDEITNLVREYRNGDIRHDDEDPRIKEVLEYNFNIRDGEPYRPARRIAEFLLDNDPSQRIPWTDRHFQHALLSHCYRRLRHAIGRPIKNVVRGARGLFQQ